MRGMGTPAFLSQWMGDSRAGKLGIVGGGGCPGRRSGHFLVFVREKKGTPPLPLDLEEGGEQARPVTQS